MFRLYVVPAFAALFAMIIALALHYMPPPGLPPLTAIEADLLGAAIFVVLLFLANHVAAAGRAARLDRQLSGLVSFEADVRRRLGRLETVVDALSAGAHREEGGVVTEFPLSGRPGDEARAIGAAGGGPVHDGPADAANRAGEDDEHKVIRLDRAGRGGTEPAAPARPSAAKLALALEQEAIEAWFQPVVTLPGRKTRFFEAVAHFSERPGDDHKEARCIEPGYCRAPEVDRLMLVQTLKLLRELDRTGKPSNAIWRLHGPALAEAHAFAGIERIIEANASFAGQLLARIELRDFAGLERGQLDRLHRLRELGLGLALGNYTDTAKGRTALRSGLFPIVIVDASRLVGNPSGNSPAETIRTVNAGQLAVEIIASGVADENQAMALIDQDVLLAQGDFFSRARPLRREPAGTSAAR